MYSRFLQQTAGWEQKLQKGEVINLLHRCVELDITSFLVTDLRGNVPAGDRFGAAISESGLSRDQIQLIAVVTVGKDIMGQVEQALLKSDTDYLDLLLLDISFSKEEIAESLEMLLSRGKILEIGSIGLRFPRKDILDENLPLMANLVTWEAGASEKSGGLLLKNLTSEEMTNMIWADPQNNQEIFRRIDQNAQAKELLDKYVINPEQLVTSWLLAHPAHLHPVIAANDNETITSVAETRKIRITEKELSLLTQILEQAERKSHRHD